MNVSTPPKLPIPDPAASRSDREQVLPQVSSPPPDTPPTGTPLGAVRRLAGRVVKDSAYLIGDYLIVLPAFVFALLTIGLSAPLFTAVLVVPILGLVMRGLATAERALQRSLLDTDIVEPVYASDFPSTGSTAGDLWRRVTDPQTWLELVWGLVGFVTATVTFVLTLTFGSIALAGLTSPLWFPFVFSLNGYSGLSDLIGGSFPFLIDLVAQLLAGVLGLALLILVSSVGARVQGSLFAALLGSRGTQARYAALQRAHVAGQEAERVGLRRLERDLHDGPQQGLVRLQMDLARAGRLMESDPAKAREILDGAGLTASQTLGELRGLSRGIAPPLLVDRGLAAALQQLAASHPARVTVIDEVPGRLPDQVETTLYFAASEALANAAKHSGAQSVQVLLRRGPHSAEAVITDDGTGGASIAKGHGLAGLQQRLAGVGGALAVDSPTGGPTVLVAQVPLSAGR